MIVWIFRAVALLGTPVLTWLTVSKDLKGLAFGLLIGVVLIGVEYVFANVSLISLIIGIVGAVGGIIMAKLLDYTVFQIGNDGLNEVWNRFNPIIRYSLALLGMIVSIRKIPEMDDLDKNLVSMGRRGGRNMKVLDISAILDGRVLDICDTHFITGGILTPRFIVQELNALAESNEPIKRAKGRRGLDILARLQESRDIPFRVIDRDIKEVSDNQLKLVTIAKELGASIVTTDFNINKLAALEKITVLNINDLAIALKPVVLPG